MTYLRGILLGSLRLSLSENNQAGAEDGARVPQPEGLVQAHQLANVVLIGGSQSDDSSNTSVELELERGM